MSNIFYIILSNPLFCILWNSAFCLIDSFFLAKSISTGRMSITLFEVSMIVLQLTFLSKSYKYQG